MSILHHQRIIEELGIKDPDNNQDTLFQAAGIELTERGNKKFIKIDSSDFGQYLPSGFRKILENPSIREIDELKNRFDDFLNTKTKSNSLEGVPVRIAFSTFPLIYKGFDKKILSLIESGNLNYREILEHSENFYLDLTINNNPNGFFGSLTSINAKIIDSPINTLQALSSEQLNKILGVNKFSYVKSDSDIGLIVSDGNKEQTIDGYSFTYDKQVSCAEMFKTPVRNSGELILDNLEDWKKERFNTSVNLKTLLDYFNNYYTTSNNSGTLVESLNPALKLFNPSDKIIIGELFIGSIKINNETDFKKAIQKYLKTDKEKYKEYIKFAKKIYFSDSGIIKMSTKDLKLTPPVILWLEKLVKEGKTDRRDSIITGTTLTEKNEETQKTSKNFENIMFEILGKKGEAKLIYSQKNNKGKFGKNKIKTPDYIESLNDSKITIYDFKVSQITTNYDDFIENNNFKFIYKKKNVFVSDVKIIALDSEVGKNNGNCIYFRDFIKQKNIQLTKKQETLLNNIESDYIFSKQNFTTNKLVQKILQ